MSLTRKLLTALGIEADKVEEIITAHTDTVDAIKADRDKYKADAEKLPAVQKELDELKAAAEKNSTEPYKQQLEDLQKEFDSYKADVEKKELEAKKESAYKALLKETGVSEKRIDAIMKVTPLDNIELDGDGKIKDAGGKKDAIKQEWADFIVAESTEGVKTPTPPQSTGGTGKKSRAAELAAKYHGELYGVRKG